MSSYYESSRQFLPKWIIALCICYSGLLLVANCFCLSRIENSVNEEEKEDHDDDDHHHDHGHDCHDHHSEHDHEHGMLILFYEKDRIT